MVSSGTETTIRTEKAHSYMRGALIWLNVLATMPFIVGCSCYDKGPSRFQRLAGRANAFRMEVTEPLGFCKEYVKEVRVFECVKGSYHDTAGQLLWGVVAVPQVRAKRFEVVV